MEKVKAGGEVTESWREAGVSKRVEWSSNATISGDALCVSCEVLDLDVWRAMVCDCLESFGGLAVASSECDCSGEADEEPARRSRSSSLLLSFFR